MVGKEWEFGMGIGIEVGVQLGDLIRKVNNTIEKMIRIKPITEEVMGVDTLVERAKGKETPELPMVQL